MADTLPAGVVHVFEHKFVKFHPLWLALRANQTKQFPLTLTVHEFVVALMAGVLIEVKDGLNEVVVPFMRE